MIKRKMWVAAGLALSLTTGAHAADGESGEGGPKPADSADKFYGATGQRDVPFSKALEKILEGSGGEGGIGFSKAGPEFVAPTLTDSQIKAALVGNTVRKDQAVAIYFGKDGKVEGWKRDWSKAASMDQCPTKLGDNYEVSDGQCWIATVNPIVGSYTIRNNSICMPAYSGKAADGNVCYYFAFITKFVVIADGKKVYGGGKDLVLGKELAAFLPRLR